ncbi:DUF6705 family protein [Chryseobacterium sp. Leaf394]|uniref:DUF6705 family protein n=1 Tax=Chryseobacterium sp. Leaf394 TaxID=1736361 RepID=UPI0006FB2953|nr:DUF6705 family protein [Chryseobacterium sp. Leaf394]KQS94313.1 hypothetical protein ASG21_18980 [Chryseobacterium sp. Leaf394]
MKNILVIILALSINQLLGQNCTSYTEVPLRTWTDIPENQCYYLKDIDNEFVDYSGTWKGTWNNKTIYITFSKVSAHYDDFDKYYEDVLIGKFKVLDMSGGVLFDNTNSSAKPKIRGGGPVKDQSKYSFSYTDRDICNIGGRIEISFSNPSKTQLNWKYSQDSQMIYPSCPYYGSANFPEALPKSTVLTKQ